jgi:molecular chaperone GrpE
MDSMTHKEKHESKSKATSSEAEAAETATPAEAELVAIRKELAEVQAQAAEYLDGWKRTQAEFANYRKRQDRDWADQQSQITGRVASHWFPVLDDLGRALREKPKADSLEQWWSGMDMIFRKGQAILESEGIAAIEVTPGQAFDPAQHEAVTMEPCAEHREGEIIGLVRGGYRMGDRILRPAQVRVACPPVDASGNTAQ